MLLLEGTSAWHVTDSQLEDSLRRLVHTSVQGATCPSGSGILSNASSTGCALACTLRLWLSGAGRTRHGSVCGAEAWVVAQDGGMAHEVESNTASYSCAGTLTTVACMACPCLCSPPNIEHVVPFNDGFGVRR
jgi:hypothetical protein